MAQETSPFERERRAQALLATRPTAITRFLRTFIPWQMIRFAAINFRMIVIIGKARH
ncbi:MAG TPA: hypothetical protein VK188_01335 [Holophaga sp.]|nr:hypothetical protein [Holophaga sp.]